ncbi:hypothetical protein OQA88_11224 [Cercophora sp. LCS_1]
MPSKFKKLFNRTKREDPPLPTPTSPPSYHTTDPSPQDTPRNGPGYPYFAGPTPPISPQPRPHAPSGGQRAASGGSARTSTSGFIPTAGGRTSGPFVNTPAGTRTSVNGMNGVNGAVKSGPSVHEVRKCTELLRKWHDLKLQVWSEEDVHESDLQEREEMEMRADHLKADLQAMINEWKRENWTADEWKEVEWIVKTLADPNWRFGEGVQAEGSDESADEERMYGWQQQQDGEYQGRNFQAQVLVNGMGRRGEAYLNAQIQGQY